MIYVGSIIYFNDFVQTYSVKLIDLIAIATDNFVNPYERPEVLYTQKMRDIKVVG